MAAGAVIIVGGLSACGSSDDRSDSKPTAPPVVATCTTNEPWSAVPGYVKASKFAAPLDVPEDDIRNGLIGLATCDKPLKMSSVMSRKSQPIVKVTDRGSRCIAMGTQEDTRNATTTKIMAICPDNNAVDKA